MKNSVMKVFLFFLTATSVADADDAGFFKFGYSCLCVTSGRKPSSILRVKGINPEGKAQQLKDKVVGFSGEWMETVRLNLTTGKKLTFTIKVRGAYSAMLRITNPSTRYDVGRTYEFKLETMLNQLVSPCPDKLDMEPSCAGKEAMFRLKKTKDIGPAISKHTFVFGFSCVCTPHEATDPYAVVYVLDTNGKQEGQAVLRTETIQNAVIGTWKTNLTFLYDEAKNQSFKIEVWDDDSHHLHRNNLLGSVTVPIDTIVKQRYTVNSLVPEKGQLEKCPKSYPFKPNTYIGICEGKLTPLVSVADRTPPPS